MTAAAPSPVAPVQDESLLRAALKGLVVPLCGVAFAFGVWSLEGRVLDAYDTVTAMNIGVAMMLAVSLNIVNGMTGQFSIGHAGFMALGGYTSGMVTYYGSLLLWGTAARQGGPFGAGEWLFAASCVAGGLVSACAGYVVGLPSLRLRGDYLAIVTLGFGEILRVLLQQTNRVIGSREGLAEAKWRELIPPPVGGAVGFNGLPKYTNLFWVGLFLSLTVIFAVRLKRSAIGRSMIAIREDEIASYSVGVNVTRVKVRSFVIAAFLAGVAGGLYAHRIGVNIEPRDAGFQRSFEYIIMTVLGGKGSVTGSMIAASILTYLPEWLRDFDRYRMIIYASLLIAMMLLRPQGLLGSREIWDFLPWFRKRRGTAR
ncbi:MAG: branched-chain amino acid ABC transporter permease [Planctomyces sp.]|nr:branched-chain amino acid ABC transporter permease [Planctomyces sp.]